ncbi:hypothetical protein GCM10010349_16370 [Streptomyces flavofungini]|nr:hypothetical protein GCM10010349_16370 [Streptomyces flavofungini]
MIAQHTAYDAEDGARHGVVDIGERLLLTAGHPGEQLLEIGPRCRWDSDVHDFLHAVFLQHESPYEDDP